MAGQKHALWWRQRRRWSAGVLLLVLVLMLVVSVVVLPAWIVPQFPPPRGVQSFDRSKEISDARSVLLVVLGSLALVAVAVVAALNIYELRRQRSALEERFIAAQTALAVAKQMGAEDAASLFVDRLDVGPAIERPWRPGIVDDEVDRRVQRVEERMRAVEDKFPDEASFQKFAQANELFLAYQVGELTKRLDRMDEKQLTRPQVVGIVLGTLVTLVGVTAGTLGILKVISVIH